MSLIVNLEGKTELQLQALAQQKGLTTETFVVQVLENVAKRQDLANASEADLLQQLGLGFSEAQWRSYHELIALREKAQLSREQHQSLVSLSDRLERANASRMSILAELAKRRQQPLEDVMKDLNIISASNALEGLGATFSDLTDGERTKIINEAQLWAREQMPEPKLSGRTLSKDDTKTRFG